jgi:hypothetical protein
MTHTAHGAAAADAGIQLQSHSGHYDLSSSAAASTLQTSTSPIHSHTGFYFTSAAAHNSGPADRFGISSALALDEALLTETHDDHGSDGNKAEPASKLVPKRCTVTYSGGLLVTSVDGKRQCDCDAKAQAAQEIKEQLAGKEGGPAGQLSLKSLADCQPCQRSALALGLPAELVICLSDPQAASASHLAGLPLPLLEQLASGSCSEMNAHSGEKPWASGTQWLSGLQVAGLTMLAASVAMIPTLRHNRESENHAGDEFGSAADWLFGRFQVELLTR